MYSNLPVTAHTGAQTFHNDFYQITLEKRKTSQQARQHKSFYQSTHQEIDPYLGSSKLKQSSQFGSTSVGGLTRIDKSRTTDDLHASLNEPPLVNFQQFKINPAFIEPVSNLEVAGSQKVSLRQRIAQSQIMFPVSNNNQNVFAKGRGNIYKKENSSAKQLPSKDPNFTQKTIGKEVKLSREDLTNYLMNGSVSKDFMNKNNSEIQNYIKKKKRLFPEQNAYFKTDFEIQDEILKKALQGHSTKPLAKDSDQPVELPKKDQVFTTDVKTEQPFLGETTLISINVIERWINQTLMEAESNMPTVILKPESRLPVARYGIDRNTFSVAGLSTNSVDRIYRCLFVYSVGFFEMLKQDMNPSSNQHAVKTITSIWKVFVMLLEYSCKTDYQFQIDKVQNQCEADKQSIKQDFELKLTKEIKEKQTLRNNLNIMQDKMESLEKEKNAEKALRSRLEEEYTQITKNHEEEVALRLKFEEKLNILNQAHRKLEITHQREKLQNEILQQNVVRLHNLQVSNVEELVSLRQLKVSNLDTIESLQNYKQQTTIELRNKNDLINKLEKDRRIANDQFDFKRYQVQDSEKMQEKISSQLESQSFLRASLQDQIKAFNVKFEDMKSEQQVVSDKLVEEAAHFQIINLHYTQNLEKLQTLQITSNDHLALIKTLRKENELVNKKSEEFLSKSITLQIDRDDLKSSHDQLKQDFSNTVTQLAQCNQMRHDVQNKLTSALILTEEQQVSINDLQLQCKEKDDKILGNTIEIKSLQDAIHIEYLKKEEIMKDKWQQDIAFKATLKQSGKNLTTVMDERESARKEKQELEKQIKQWEHKQDEYNHKIHLMQEKCQAVENKSIDHIRKWKQVGDELDLAKNALTDQQNFLSQQKAEMNLRDLSIKHIQKQIQELKEQHKNEIMRLQSVIMTQQMTVEDSESRMQLLISTEKEFQLIKSAQLEAEAFKEFMDKELAERNQKIALLETETINLTQQQKTYESELKKKMGNDSEAQFQALTEQIIMLEEKRLKSLEVTVESLQKQIIEQKATFQLVCKQMEEQFQTEMHDQFIESEKLHATIKQLDLQLHPSKVYQQKREGLTSAEIRRAQRDKKMQQFIMSQAQLQAYGNNEVEKKQKNSSNLSSQDSKRISQRNNGYQGSQTKISERKKDGSRESGRELGKVQESSSESETEKEKEFEEFLDFIIKKDQDALASLKFNLQRKRKGERPSIPMPDANPKIPDRFSQMRLLKRQKQKIRQTQEEILLIFEKNNQDLMQYLSSEFEEEKEAENYAQKEQPKLMKRPTKLMTKIEDEDFERLRLSIDQEQQEAKEQTKHSKKLRQNLKKHKADYMTSYEQTIENQPVDPKKRAQYRQKSSYVLVQPDSLIQGVKPLHLIMKMAQSGGNQYEKLRERLLNEINEAVVKEKLSKLSNKQEMARLKIESQAMSIVDKHKRKVIEKIQGFSHDVHKAQHTNNATDTHHRHSLNQNNQGGTALERLKKGSLMGNNPLNGLMMGPMESLAQDSVLLSLLKKYDEDEGEFSVITNQLIRDKIKQEEESAQPDQNLTIHDLKNKLKEIDRQTVMDHDFNQLIQGGVAGVNNKQREKSLPGQESPGKGNMRKLIRGAVARDY